MGTQNTLFEFIKTITPSKEYNDKEKDQLLQEILPLIIGKLVKIGDDILKSTGKNSHDQFMPPNKKLPAITIKDYLCRLMKYSPCSKECFISSLLYIDRLLLECGLSINSYNIHRILITTLLISTKYLDDIFYNNEFYSQVGGVGLKEMNTLELDFLKLLKFSAFCPIPLFNEYQKEMENTKSRFLLGPNHPINQINIITTINKLPISIINNSSPSSSPRNSSSSSCISTPSSSNQTVPNSPTNGSAIVSSPNINVNSNNGNTASVVPQSNVIINNSNNNNNSNNSNINTNNNNNNNNNNNSNNSSNNNSPITLPNNNNNNNNNNNGSNSFNTFQRRGSCDYETRLPSQTNEKSTFHTNCAA
ncbi:cyclin-related 2 family protein [Dictyostelium discoideum AX4]|uniref:Cyclin-related 2 family protein n=1 Tax=Dictyostelium discoideum TaxID=44689 RepID=C7G042_DICDI|nr:cyclin-related 2 family protein [Dictyostelium discoideum AX4]EEU04078.1 cyclin-related 2 family protein [Dictyostelium discoideum AX4]|eukprot:XP_002649130.1 cyclin-related 2 family protein [Dictyostelium discoideum AX4]